MNIHTITHSRGAVSRRLRLFIVLMTFGGMFLRLTAAPHRYNHVLIVVEENRTQSQIIGDLVNAPYITSLANGGGSMDRKISLGHPSPPTHPPPPQRAN